MATILANRSAQVTLPAGQYISGTGAGVAQVGSGGAGADPLTAGDAWQIGPFLTQQTVHLTAYTTLGYDILSPLAAPPVGLTAAQTAATQALVSTPGNPSQPGPATAFFSATGGGSGLVADGVPAPWAVAATLSGKKGCIPEFGPEPLYARDPIVAGGGQVLTQPFVRDHLGIPRQAAAGQVLTAGQRLEENLIRFSDNLTNGTNWLTANGCTVTQVYDYDLPYFRRPDRNGAYVTQVVGAALANSLVRVNNGILPTLRAVPHRVSFWARVPSGSLTFEVRFYIVAGANLVTSTFTLTAAQGWQRLCLNLGTPDGTSAYVVGIAPGTFAGAAGGTLRIGGVMLQERLGAETAPSEHISTDDIPVSGQYWYGLGVDRVECFGTTNANTVTAGAFSASAGGAVVETAGVPLTKYGLRSSPTVQQFARTDVNNWTVTRATVATGIAAPDGTLTAFDVVEDGTASQSHFAAYTLVGTNTYDNQYMVFSAFAKRRSGSDRQWIYVAFADLTATNKGAFFDLQNGIVGTVSAGLYADIEPWANGWYRCMVRGSVGAGVSDVQARLFVANGDNQFAPTVSTTANGVSVWCPNVTGPLSSTGSARAMPTRPALNASTSIGLIPGSILAWDIAGIYGRTDFGARGKVSLYGSIDQPYKSGAGFVYSGAGYVTSSEDFIRCGLSWRPGADGAPGGVGSHTLKLAFDAYVGEVNDRFFWRPNQAYTLGQIAIPTDTLPGNSNNRKMFTCVVAGTSGGSEPAWNTTVTAVPDTVTNLTTDGTVRWQVNTPNGIASNWEEYLGAHQKPAQTGFNQQIGWGWYITSTNYGCFLNGVESEKQTVPQLNNGLLPVLPRRARLIWYGNQNATASWPTSAPAGYNPSGSMGVWDTDHQDLVLWHTAPTSDLVTAASV